MMAYDRNFRFVSDAKGYTKREMKPLRELPFVRELAMSTTFVTRAKAWSWHVQGPTEVPNTGSNWAPWVPNGPEGVAEYYHAVLSRHQAHRPDLVTETTSLEDCVALALALSSANPLLDF